MVTSCCAFGCTVRQKKGCYISFHRFPQDPELKKKWLIALKRVNFVPTAASRICGKHFKEEDFVRQFGKLCLQKTAVPSIFNLQRRKPVARQTPNIICPNINETPSSSVHAPQESLIIIVEEDKDLQTNVKNTCMKKHNRCLLTRFGKFKEKDLRVEGRAKKMWELSKKILHKQSNTIRHLQSQTLRMRNRIKRLNNTITRLEKSNAIPL